MTSVRPTVSVVVATYNRREHLARAIESVFAQTVRDWECLICDDGSTDGTIEFVQARIAADSRLRLIRGPRAGLPAVPRNRGIVAARGEWVAFLDDDDLWHPFKLQRQLAIAERVPCEAVSVRSVAFIGDGRPQFPAGTDNQTATQLTLTDVLVQRQPYPSTPATMVRREVLVAVGGFAESPAYRAVEDYDLWCRLLAKPDMRWFIDAGRPLAAYRDQGADSISSWNRVVDPDVIRQRWAVLESMTRTLAVAPETSPAERSAAFESLIRRADDCAGRCLKIGWRAAAAQAYGLAFIGAAKIGRAHEAALRVWRLFRMLVRRPAPTTPMPDVVPLLMRRALTQGAMTLVGLRMIPSVLPIDRSGRWSSLAGA